MPVDASWRQEPRESSRSRGPAAGADREDDALDARRDGPVPLQLSRGPDALHTMSAMWSIGETWLIASCGCRNWRTRRSSGVSLRRRPSRRAPIARSRSMRRATTRVTPYRNARNRLRLDGSARPSAPSRLKQSRNTSCAASSIASASRDHRHARRDTRGPRARSGGRTRRARRPGPRRPARMRCHVVGASSDIAGCSHERRSENPRVRPIALRASGAARVFRQL